MKKRFLSLVLILCMLCTLLPISAFAADVIDSGKCGANATWTMYGDGKLLISGEGSMEDYSHYVKDYHPITTAPWGDYACAWRDCAYFITPITSVEIAEGITSIGDYAFFGCQSVESVTIPGSVTTIGSSTFEGCSLDSVCISNLAAWCGIRYYFYSSLGDAYALYLNGEQVTDLVIPDNVTSISDCAFHGCGSIKSVTIPDSVTSIGSSAFAWCYDLGSVTFDGCPNSISDDAFRNVTATACYYVEDNWPETMLVDYGGNLTWVPLSRHIHNYTAVVTAPTCTEKGYTTYTCACGDSYKDDFADALGHYCENGICTVCGAIGIIDSGTCGDNVTWTLYGDGKLLISGEGNMANYHYCYTEYSAVTTAPWGAYEESISSVEITDGVTSIGDYAFCGCHSLESMTIGSNVTSIGEFASFGCNSLASIVVASDNKIYSSQDGTLFNKDKTELIQYPIGNTRTSYTIPDSVTSIGNSAFYNCRSLTSVTIPDSVTSIGDKAFDGSENLTSVTMGNGVTSIGDYAFYICSSLTSVTIPDSVTSIGNEAFRECYSLESITIPDSVTSIEKLTFHNCVSLTSVTIGSGVTSIGDYAFSQCYSLKSVAIPDSVMSIGDYAFAWCYDLGSVTIGSGITSIGLFAFGDFRNVTSIVVASDNKIYSSQDGTLFNKDKTELIQYPIGNTRTNYTIPDSVTSISGGAFGGCESLTSVTFDGCPNSISDDAFIDVTATAYYYIEDNWPETMLVDYGGNLTWVPLSRHIHNYTAVVTAPTCTKKGYTTYICACGDSYVADEADALGHDFGDWTVTTEASCTEKGVETRYCSCCDATETRKVAALNHSYTAEVTAPTCLAKGYTTYTCACGDSYIADEVAALGHDFGEWTVTTAATCTEKGEEIHYCSRCDATETREVNALGHDLVHHDGKAASCTENGWEAYDTCSRCDYTTYKEIPTAGHSYTAEVTAPTCLAKGYTTYTCACGDSYIADEVAALGHDFGEWTVTTAATCTEKGEETRCCNRCNATETREIAALGHSYADGACTRCGAKDPDYKPPVQENPFVDVLQGKPYYDAVLWAYYHKPQQITGGFDATHFVPNNPCTRAQVVTFLWRAKGCPEPASTNNPFSDVSEKQANGKDNPYYKAILWAAEEGITTGYAGGLFKPNDTVTRAQFVTFLWRADGRPDTSGSINGFADAAQIATPYQQAVAWAVEKGITTGYAEGDGTFTFRPNAACTRWAVVLFMYRDMK